MTVDSGAMLPLSGVVDNSGTIYLGSTNAETDLEVVGNATLQGGGQIVLSDNSANVIYGATAKTTSTMSTTRSRARGRSATDSWT